MNYYQQLQARRELARIAARREAEQAAALRTELFVKRLCSHCGEGFAQFDSPEMLCAACKGA